MPERLQLTQNAQFYLPKNEISDEAINAVLGAAADNLSAGGEFLINEFRRSRTLHNSEVPYTYSARVFPTDRPVYFINDALQDRIYAYIFIIEIRNYIAVFKKSCANITDTLDNHFTSINHAILTATFDDEDVEFQKISLRNMTVSDSAMRARSYEATDLKGLLSTHAAGRSIPYYFKIRQDGSLKTISASTGRVVESSERKSINEIALWASQQIHLINNPLKSADFSPYVASLNMAMLSVF